MNAIKSWVYLDSTNIIWKFALNDNRELQYTIKNKEGKWNKEKLIDKDVTGFFIYNNEETIQIIYSNFKGELKYCTYSNNQWMGKIIYIIDQQNVEIKDIKVIKSGQKINIFCLLIDYNSNDHGIILHCIWDGTETNVVNQQDIILYEDINEYYLVYLDENRNIDLVFVSDEGNEISLNYSSCKNNKWTDAKRLYGILGDTYEFNIIKDQTGIHILNKYRDDSICNLEHVLFKNNGEFINSSIIESHNEITETILVKIKDKIYSFWLDENKIYSSVFDEFTWSKPVCLNDANNEEILKCKFCAAKEKQYYIDREVYEENFNLIFPSKLVLGEEENLNTNKEKLIDDNDQELIFEDKPKNKQNNNDNLMSEITRIQSEKTILMQTISSLNLQLQYQERILSELDVIYKRLENEKGYREDMMEKFKKLEEEIKILDSKVDKLNEDNIKLNKALEFGKNFIL